MKIELHETPIQEIVKYSKHLKECQGYIDKEEEGVYGMNGRLNIRPIYQREFIYKDKQRNAVIETIRNGFPLNVLYWVENKDGGYEVLDGQQRLISIGQYVKGDFSIKWPELGNLYFHNLTEDQRDQILNYKLMVYFCEGTDSEKLDWFRIINIAGEKLEEQELRNAVFAGPWVSNAKRYFSRNGCPAYQLAADLLKGHVIRQDYLETAIEWISKGNIEAYMAERQHEEDAKELWGYFESVIEWTQKIFPKYRKEMKGVPFGLLFNEYKGKEYDSDKIEEEVSRLMQDEDVTKKPGIYSYIFTRDERSLNIRTFSDNQKREVYEKQKGICIHCKKHFEIEEMEGDHITPWSEGGKTESSNCQMLCIDCNRRKGAQ
jgi:hypothetical protein